jgi:hypothetical protein
MDENIVTREKWTQDHLNILKKWKIKIFAYMWMQNESCYYFTSIYNWVAYTVICTSSFAGATMFSINSFQTKCENINGIPALYIQYFIGSISLLSAILTGIIRQIKPGEYSQIHSSTFRRYNVLLRTIDEVVISQKCDTLPDEFINTVSVTMNDIINEQKEPPKSIIKKFEKTYGPLERILYGEDILELCKMKQTTNNILNNLS